MVNGRGVTYCKYELVRTYVGGVAEVEVKRSTGEIRVHEVLSRPRLRADHQSRWAARTSSKATSSRP